MDQMEQTFVSKDLLSTEAYRLTSKRAINPLHRPGYGATNLLYSMDGKYLFQRQSHIIRVLSSTTGYVLHECIREDNLVEYKSTTYPSEVIAMACHPLNQLQLITVYKDGKLFIWDFIEQHVLQSYELGASILWMGVSSIQTTILYVIVHKSTDKDGFHGKWQLMEFNLKKKRRGRVLCSHDKAEACFHTAAIQSYSGNTIETQSIEMHKEFRGDFITIIDGTQIIALRIPRVGNQEMKVQVRKFIHQRPVTCIAINPWKLEFSIGDEIGQIHQYQGSDIYPSGIITTGNTVELAVGATIAKFHWHSHAVHSILYSTDGQYLVSGGEECVLVTWHIESGRRSYLPRRSAPIERIATHQTTRPKKNDTYTSRSQSTSYAVELADHSLFQYNYVTREHEWSVLGFARSGSDPEVTLPSRKLVLDPRTMTVPLNGSTSTGQIQFYDPWKDRVSFTIPLTQRNHVTRTENEKLPEIRMERLSFNNNGTQCAVLVSCDEVNTHSKMNNMSPQSSSRIQTLQFWKLNPAESRFELQTAVESPHGTNAMITSLEFANKDLGFAVSGDDLGRIKLWKVQGRSHDASTSSTAENNQLQWYCEVVMNFRNEPVSCLAFAIDDSILAISYSKVVTFLDVSTFELRALCSTWDGNIIESIAFGKNGKFSMSPNSHFLLVKTSESIMVWNALSQSWWWNISIVPDRTLYTFNPMSGDLCLWLKPQQSDFDILVVQCHLDSPQPVAARHIKGLQNNIWSLVFHPTSGDLLLLDDESNFWSLPNLFSGEVMNQLPVETTIGDVNTTEKIANAPLGRFYGTLNESPLGKRKRMDSSNNLEIDSPIMTTEQVHPSTSAMFDAPAHVLPSMSALYRKFMDSMLPKQKDSTTESYNIPNLTQESRLFDKNIQEKQNITKADDFSIEKEDVYSQFATAIKQQQNGVKHM